MTSQSNQLGVFSSTDTQAQQQKRGPLIAVIVSLLLTLLLGALDQTIVGNVPFSQQMKGASEVPASSWLKG